jgi:hypothetical protein
MASGLGFDQQYSSGSEEPFQTPSMSLSFTPSFGSSMNVFDLGLAVNTGGLDASYLPDASIASVKTTSQSNWLWGSSYQEMFHQPEG